MTAEIYFGVMSGTSLDGADVVALQIDSGEYNVIGAHSVPFSGELRTACLQLQASMHDEIHHAQQVSNKLADLYSGAINELLADLELTQSDIKAVGVHGQTIRHRPECGYTVQLNQPARIAEQTGVTVVSDFRARDIAAGGQGAPLVPAFHDALWRDSSQNRVVLNIGGFSNISVLNVGESTFGFDTGPGNVLMDGWIYRHQGKMYDANGAWAASGVFNESLLDSFLSEPFFSQPPPKSTGRDAFHMDWLDAHLSRHIDVSPENVQATLLELTARTISDAVKIASPHAASLIVAGGGALNRSLMLRLQMLTHATVTNSGAHGIDPMHLEAAAFAWLAQRTMNHLSGNLPAVTGARGERILGSVSFG